MKNTDMKRHVLSRVTEMVDFLTMEAVHCDELKHYQHKVHTQLKYDIETYGLDFVIELLKKYRNEIKDIKQSQLPGKIYRASEGTE